MASERDDPVKATGLIVGERVRKVKAPTVIGTVRGHDWRKPTLHSSNGKVLVAGDWLVCVRWDGKEILDYLHRDWLLSADDEVDELPPRTRVREDLKTGMYGKR